MKALVCVHVDTCLDCYWSGHPKAHVQIPVYKGMHIGDVKLALHNELNQGYVMGDDKRTGDDSGDAGDKWYKAAHAAVNRLKPAIKGKRRMFESLDKVSEDDDTVETVYAYFIFVDKE